MGIAMGGSSAPTIRTRSLLGLAEPMNWVVLKMMGPFWVYIILWHLMSRGTKMGP